MFAPLSSHSCHHISGISRKLSVLLQAQTSAIAGAQGKLLGNWSPETKVWLFVVPSVVDPNTRDAKAGGSSLRPPGSTYIGRVSKPRSQSLLMERLSESTVDSILTWMK